VSVEDHEAGHAVAAVLCGHQLHHVTIVPTDRDGGHAQADPPKDWWKTPSWVDFGTVVAAGMVGEVVGHARYFDDQTSDLTIDYVRSLAAYSGGPGNRPLYDTGTLRWMARAIWDTAQTEPAGLGPAFDPDWSAAPDGVAAIAGHCWSNAVRLLSEHSGSLTRVARALRKHKTLTGDQVATMMTRRPYRRPIDPELVGTDFWLAGYSRIVWRPHGMCRTNRGQLVAA
jgi:hypothetical protein